ncbi:MAG: hypothetical protein JWO09_1314 [Bacteroidetes bacterium]|nr:hypothetical protein [Bacteroidota bacterium]
METLILKMMLSWAILIIGFVALFAGCNNVPDRNAPTSAYPDASDDSVPDNTRTDGIMQKSMADTAAAHKTN